LTGRTCDCDLAILTFGALALLKWYQRRSAELHHSPFSQVATRNRVFRHDDVRDSIAGSFNVWKSELRTVPVAVIVGWISLCRQAQYTSVRALLRKFAGEKDCFKTAPLRNGGQFCFIETLYLIFEELIKPV